MSYKSYREVGKHVWENWTRGLKNDPDPVTRKNSRQEVKEMKRARHKYERAKAKRDIREALE